MKILVLSSLYPPHTKGGGEISTHLIAQGLVQRGHDVEVITAGRRAEQVTLDGVTVRRAPLPLTAKPLFEQRHSQAVAKKLSHLIGDPAQYDIIHAHDFRTTLALSHLNISQSVITVRDYAQICGSPNNLWADGTTCTECHTLKSIMRNQAVVEASLPRRPFRIWQYWYNLEFRQRAFRTFHHHIFISHAQQAEIAKQQSLDQASTHVIYNPVAPSYLTSPPRQSRGQRLLYVGTMQMYKGVPLLLEAFAKLAKHNHEVELQLVGDGAERTQLEQWVEQRGLQYRVTFIGRVPPDRLQRLYDEAKIVVAPHIWLEPFGRTTAEAMARGKLVVVANHGGPAEIVQNNVTGFTFVPRSVDALVSRLNHVVKLGDIDQREVQKNARRWAEEHLTISQIAAQYEAVYQGILSNRIS